MLGVRIPPALPPRLFESFPGVRVVAFFGRITGFLGEVRAEVRKVVFPSRSETLGSTGVVIVFVMILGVYLAIMDGIWLNVVGMVIR